jgi:hypothetical protein
MVEGNVPFDEISQTNPVCFLSQHLDSGFDPFHAVETVRDGLVPRYGV